MKKLLFAVIFVFTLIGCDNTETGDTGDTGNIYSFSEIANYFVDDLYYDSAGLHDLAITKLNSQQDGYIVVYDYVSGQQLAVNVGLYDPDSDNAETYYHTAEADAHVVYLSHYDVGGAAIYTDGYDYY